MALVSVALSTYNGERYLREQLDSVLAQVGVELEIVAVDDGSTDGTRSILDEFAARDARLRWSANPANLGPTRSFERAMGGCRGEFIAPCDQDDVWLSHKLQRLLAAIGEADLAYADSAYMDADGTPCGRRVSDDTTMLDGTDPRRFLFANSVSGHAALVRRECALAAMPFPAGGYHDWWLALNAAGGRGVRYVPEVLVRYRRHAGAVCGMGRGGARRDDWLSIRRDLIAAYGERGGRGREVAAALSRAMADAPTGGDRGRLLGLLWAQRDAWPRRTGVPALDALALAVRLRRKLGRAGRVAPTAAG